jgi:hypothetical protein
MYNWSVGDSLKAWGFNGSTFAPIPVSQGAATGQAFPGGYLTLSANGETAGTGVIWASTAAGGDAENNPPVPGILHAYDASNLTNELWNSTQNAFRDAVGNLAKFTPPLVSNGRVYMATWSNRVAVYGLLAGGGGGGATAVNFSSVANVFGIVNNGTAVPNGGLDGVGFAYSAALLGASIVWNGNTYSLLGAGIADAVSNKTISLPAGNYSTISLLGAAVNGNQPSQTFIVNYTDGTNSTFTQSLSDWFTPQNYSGESQVLQMAYRVAANGSLDNRTFYLYGYSFTLNSAKTVASIVLPANKNVVMLALDLQ